MEGDSRVPQKVQEVTEEHHEVLVEVLRAKKGVLKTRQRAWSQVRKRTVKVPDSAS